MDDLNTNQIVLLTLLVSFVTSIATGIITVSLLQQAPLEVTRTINRVVEKTIEKVTPTDLLSTKPKEVTTVVVKEEDLILNSIDKNQKSIVRIYERDPVAETKQLYGLGVVTTKDGLIATTRRVISIDMVYTAVDADGVELSIAPIVPDKQTSFMLFRAARPSKGSYAFSPATLATVEPSLGQTIIGLGGDTTNAVSVGRVSSFIMKENDTSSSTTKFVSGIETDLSSRGLLSGSPFFNLSGDIIGMKLSEAETSAFTPITIFTHELPQLVDKK
ncbi:MAG: serine protease Do [Patescibacteria group bacterium]|nr:serine protease Do [Patescibacteria group bacterium]